MGEGTRWGMGGRAAPGAVSQSRGRLWRPPRGLPGAFLTSGSALQALAWAWRAGSAGMLKPLASSRAASSVSCGQGKEAQLPTRGPGPLHTPKGSVALASQPIFLYLVLVAADTPCQGARAQVWVTGTGWPQLEQQPWRDWPFSPRVEAGWTGPGGWWGNEVGAGQGWSGGGGGRLTCCRTLWMAFSSSSLLSLSGR